MPAAGARAEVALPWWRRFRFTLAGIGLTLVWIVLVLGPMRGHPAEPMLGSLFRIPLLLTAAVLAIARARATHGRRRASLTLIACSLVSVAIGELLWILHYARAPTHPGNVLGPWDAFYLGYFVLLLMGLLLLPRIFASGSDFAKFVLDATIVVVGGGMFIWQFGMTPLIEVPAGAITLQHWIDVAYPLGDLLTLVGVSTILLRLPVGSARVSYLLLTQALLASMLGDLVWAVAKQGSIGAAAGDFAARTCWFAQALFFLAAAESARIGPVPVRLRAQPRPTLALLPYAALIGGYGLVAWMASTDRIASLRSLLVWASVLTVAVVLRQAIASRENAQLLRERERVAGQSRLAKLIENAADGIVVLAGDLRILYASPPAERMLLGAAGGDLRRRSIRGLLHRDDAEALSLKLAGLERDGGGKLMLRFIPGDGGQVLTETTLTDQRRDPELAGIVLNIRDVTAHHALEDQLRFDALHEPLTQLPGRELFLDRVQRGLAALAGGGHVAVAVLEIDQFRLVNDSLGRASGDQLLLVCAERLRQLLGERDTLARLSDTGFALLLGGGDEAPQARVERMTRALAAPITLGGASFSVTCSVGIAVATAPLAADELLRDADIALTMARADGGGRCRVFAPEQHAQVMQRLSLQAFIPEAIEQGRFIMHLQPVVGLVDGFPIALRPRLRWRDPATAPFPIRELRESLRASDIGMQLSEWVLDRAQREFANVIRYQSGAQHLSLLFPISGRHLRHPALIDRVQLLLQQLGLAAINLHLSISEDSLTHDSDTALAALRRLRRIGVRLGLAEFGGRASSLASLHENLFDLVLLSAQLVRSLTPASQATAIVRGVIALGEGVGARVIAAGVDGDEPREILSDLGCLYGIGEALAPAMPIEHLLPWLGGRLAERM